ncbi:MAG: DEAD/DEAH box helicase family protein, partial [Clostridia bacterium]|nr:DEAD/DEAH box helicase family protein [Clostridia bacterium]
MVAQVVVDVIHSNVAKPFSYLIPEGMQPVIGSRVNVPLGRRTVDGFVVGLMDESQLPPEVPPEKLKPISKMLDEYPALLPAMLDLAREIASETHCPLSEALRLMLPAAMRTGRIKQKQETVAVLTCADAEAEAAQMKRAPKRAMLLRLLADGRPRSLNELSQLVQNPREGLKALEEAGLVRLMQREVFRSPYGEEDEKPSTQPPLTDGQREALDSMLPAMEAGEGAFLLHGVTGSGKTEVYLAMASRALEMGKGAIILVPEIALTPQMVRWFRSRFGPATAVLHSRLTDGQRYDEWR